MTYKKLCLRCSAAGLKEVVSAPCQDAEIMVEYRPVDDAVDPSNMLCAGKVCVPEYSTDM